MRIWCMNCGKSVSTEVPEGTLIRASVECPECIEKRGTVGPFFAQRIDDKLTFLLDHAYNVPKDWRERLAETGPDSTREGGTRK